MIEGVVGGGKVGKKGGDALDEGIEIAHFISNWGDYGGGGGGQDSLEGRGHAVACGDAVGLATCILTAARNDLKIRGLRAVVQLCTESTHNRRVLSACGVASLAIECFASNLTAGAGQADGGIGKVARDLIAAVGAYRLSVADMASIARLGLSPTGSLKVAIALLADLSPGLSAGLPVNEALEAKQAAGTGVPLLQFPFFECVVNGESRGTQILEIPTLTAAWPPRTGFSFCAWVKVDPPAVLRGPGSAGPSIHLVSLSKLKGGSSELSISVAVSGGVVRLWSQGGKMDASFPSRALEYGRLHHVAVVYQKRMLESDVVGCHRAPRWLRSTRPF